MFPELSLRVNGQESEYPFSVNAYKSEYSKIDESENIYESGKIFSSVNVVSEDFGLRKSWLVTLEVYKRTFMVILVLIA